MRRAELEHLIRAAATIADDDEIVVIGSQPILGQFPEAPAELCRSMEADVWPRNHPERWELVDGSIGELSPFHEAFGYHALGVGPETAVLPEGWEERSIRVQTPHTSRSTTPDTTGRPVAVPGVVDQTPASPSAVGTPVRIVRGVAPASYFVAVPALSLASTSLPFLFSGLRVIDFSYSLIAFSVCPAFRTASARLS